jgi:hypothetical protein
VSDEELPEVYCPFYGGPCPAAPDVNGNPTCPTVRERVCINGLPGDDDE